jgi:hypothetical protein
MVAPLGVLPVGPAVSTTEFEEDVDGGPPGSSCRQVRQHPPSSFKDDINDRTPGGGRCCRWVRLHPPPSLKTTSMVGPLGALSTGPAASTTEFEDDVNGGVPGGHCQRVW